MTVDLRSGDLALELEPECGGTVRTLYLTSSSGPVHLLRPTPAEAIAAREVTSTACYPLVPFSNRIKDGLFSFRNQQYRMAPNRLPHPHPMHGHGWQGSWEVDRHAADAAVLSFAYAGDDFPSAYRATQQFELSASALSVRVTLKNTGDRAMPCGIGLHPFFVKPPDTRLTIATRNVWLSTDDAIPVTRVDVPSRWDFSSGRPLGNVVLDNCFGGWDGQALIEWPGRGLRLRMRAEGPFEHTVIFTPAGQEFFCVEPVTNANDVFNLSARGVEGVGLQVLEPGEELAGRVQLALERMA